MKKNWKIEKAKTRPLIYHLPERPDDPHLPGWKGSGWYYADEAHYLCGPYETESEARAALNSYCWHEMGGGE